MSSSVKRESHALISSTTNVILCDIEGTTSSISFVKETLFPYVRDNLESYVKHSWTEDRVKKVVEALKKQAKEDKDNSLEDLVEIPDSEEECVLQKAIIDNVLWQMKNDRKTKCLKDLQGLILEEGYKNGKLKGHVYNDVESNFKSWTEAGKSIYIYSSGSVHAQKLLFGHSDKGDLLPFIKGHFDTAVGMKCDADSYNKILTEIGCDASEVAFLTDVPKEANAAKKSGIMSILVSREENALLAAEDIADFVVISSFDELELQHSSKRRKISSNHDGTKENKNHSDCVVSVDQDMEVDDPKPTTNLVNGEQVCMDIKQDETKNDDGTEEVCAVKTVAMDTNLIEESAEAKEEQLSEEKMSKSVGAEAKNVDSSGEPGISAVVAEAKEKDTPEEPVTKSVGAEGKEKDLSEESGSKSVAAEAKEKDSSEKSGSKSVAAEAKEKDSSEESGTKSVVAEGKEKDSSEEPGTKSVVDEVKGKDLSVESGSKSVVAEGKEIDLSEELGSKSVAAEAKEKNSSEEPGTKSLVAESEEKVTVVVVANDTEKDSSEGKGSKSVVAEAKEENSSEEPGTKSLVFESEEKITVVVVANDTEKDLPEGKGSKSVVAEAKKKDSVVERSNLEVAEAKVGSKLVDKSEENGSKSSDIAEDKNREKSEDSNIKNSKSDPDNPNLKTGKQIEDKDIEASTAVDGTNTAKKPASAADEEDNAKNLKTETATNGEVSESTKNAKEKDSNCEITTKESPVLNKAEKNIQSSTNGIENSSNGELSSGHGILNGNSKHALETNGGTDKISVKGEETDSLENISVEA